MLNTVQSKQKFEGVLYFVAFASCVPIANYLIQYVGTFCVPETGPCLIPVAPGITAPSGVLMVGIALILRDLIQRRLGFWWAVGAILIGALLSSTFSAPSLVFASTVAFLLSEIADLIVYTPLQKKGLIIAAVTSSIVGLVVDSMIFLQLAFGSLEYVEGQILGKLWMVLVAIPFLYWIRSRDRRLGYNFA